MLNEIPPEAATEVEEVLHTLGQESGMPTILLTRMDEASWSVWATRDDGQFGFSVGRRIEVTQTLCDLVRRAGVPLAVDDTRSDERVRDHPAYRELGIAAYIGVPFRLPDGSIVGTLCAVDRTPHIGLEAALHLYRLFARLLAHEFELADSARASLAALNSATESGTSRERFLAAVAHDLRTPLAAIEASAQLVVRRSHRLDTEARWAERIIESAQRMGRLIDDLLDLARGRLGSGIPIRRRPIADVKGFLTGIATELAAAHGERVLADIRVDPLTAWWDRDRVAQCLDNIITNACVHGAPDSPVTVIARSSSSQIIVDVVNVGEIPSADRSTLFDPFHGAQTVRRGLGLGLFIADQIARAHGGAIEVDSVHGRTSTRILLPLA